MKKKIFFALLSVCLMIFCFSVAFADSSNTGKTSGYIEANYLEGGNEMVDLNGEVIASYDMSLAAATLNSNERSDHSSPTLEFVETCANDDNYSECELVMSAIDDNTYEVAMPDGEVIGTLYMCDDENFAVPYVAYSIDWSVRPGYYVHGNRYVESYAGLTFTIELNATPRGDTRIGFYRYDNSEYCWVPEIWNNVSITGYFVLNNSYGPVTLAMRNLSSNTIRYTGAYDV